MWHVYLATLSNDKAEYMNHAVAEIKQCKLFNQLTPSIRFYHITVILAECVFFHISGILCKMACVHASHIWTFSPLAFAWANTISVFFSVSFAVHTFRVCVCICVSLDLCFGYIRQFLDILNSNNETLINKRKKKYNVNMFRYFSLVSIAFEPNEIR